MTMLENSHGSRPKHHMAEAALKFVSHNPFEAEVAARAVAYTTICFLGHGKYDRSGYSTLADAPAGAPRHSHPRRASCVLLQQPASCPSEWLPSLKPRKSQMR